MTCTPRGRRIGLFTVVVLATLLLRVESVRANTVPPNVYGDAVTPNSIAQFYNWDNTCSTAGCENNGNVDQPVTMFFYGSANKSAVDNGLASVGFCTSLCSGHTEWGYFLNVQASPNFQTDGDGGRKDCDSVSNFINSCDDFDYHFRTYAYQGNENGFDPTWGFWVFTTTHEDVDEASNNFMSQFGYNDNARDHLAGLFASVDEWPTMGAFNAGNAYEMFQANNNGPGTSIYQHDGLVTEIKVN
jgi:hypothetical protein